MGKIVQTAGRNALGDLPYEEEAMRAHAKEMVFPIGAPNDGFAQYFSGRSFLAPISTSQVGIFNVTFEPGCRNNWHIHHAKSGGGQILVCVAGRGYYQEEGKEAVEMKPGDCINIPTDVKHWHGAAPDEWFSHLAIEVPGENGSNEWLEPVSDEEYGKLQQAGEKIFKIIVKKSLQYYNHLLLYDFVSDILKHKENRVKLQFAFCTVSFTQKGQLKLT